MQIRHPIKNSHVRIKHVEVDPVAYMPPFSFSLGMSEIALPELIVFALSAEVAEEILERVMLQLFDDNLVLVDGAYIEKAAAVQLKSREISPGQFFGFAASHIEQYEKRASPGRFFQLVLPDSNGRFPGDEGCDAITNYSQTIEILLQDDPDRFLTPGSRGSKIRF